MRVSLKAGSSVVPAAPVGTPGTFGYVNEADPFGFMEEADPFSPLGQLLGPWWQQAFDQDRVMTHEMLSEVIWHSVMMSAKSLRYKFIKYVPTCRDIDRQRAQAMAQILKFQLLLRMVGNWHSLGLVSSNADNFKWLQTNLDGMQESYQKRYSVHRVYD